MVKQRMEKILNAQHWFSANKKGSLSIGSLLRLIEVDFRCLPVGALCRHRSE